MIPLPSVHSPVEEICDRTLWVYPALVSSSSGSIAVHDRIGIKRAANVKWWDVSSGLLHPDGNDAGSNHFKTFGGALGRIDHATRPMGRTSVRDLNIA
jgi:hypothetical protein